MIKKTHSSNSALTALVVVSIIVSVILLGMVYHLGKSMKLLKIQVNQATQPNIVSESYKCDGDKTINAQFFDDKAEVELSDGRNLLLMQGISASGVRYTNSDETITFWTKGTTAFVEEGPTQAVTYNNCNQTNN